LCDDDPTVRREAAGAFVELGAQAEHYHDGDELTDETRERVVNALVERLSDPEPTVRSWVMKALGAQAHPTAVGPLCDAYDEETDLRWNAIAALGRLRDPRAIPTVVSALDDDDSGVRRRACRACARLETGAAVTPLCERVRSDVNEGVRREAVDALGRIGTVRPEVVETMSAALAEEDADVRRTVVTALGRMHGPAVHRLLRETASDDPDGAIRELAQTKLE
jgi:HEAT repeat protein